jgi:hypothetical protein
MSNRVDWAYFADLIRKGLSLPGVVENRCAWGVVKDRGEISANVIGLALIGALGSVQEAAMLSEARFEEGMNGIPGPAMRRGDELLRLPQEEREDLVALHFGGTSASEIAKLLEDGKFPKGLSGSGKTVLIDLDSLDPPDPPRYIN